jgi:uncharacterized protein YjbI with pentapeptide repeats
LGVEPPDLRAGRSAEDAEPPPPPIALGAESFAKKADDLESIRAAVDDAAAVGGALWFSYLFVLFYLAVAAGAVTHADLFLENPVKLPFLNIDLPLLAFFFLAPILFLFAHGYTLMHLVMLTEKAKDYDQALREQIGADNLIGDKLRRQLPSNIFIQYLAGPARLRKSAFGYALGFVAWTTLAVAPVLLLLMMQLQFLPFHSSFITWTQRIVLTLDLALIWWLWGTIRSGREIDKSRGALFWTGRTFGLAAGIALTVGAILFSTAVATFPGEWQEDHLPSARILPEITNDPPQSLIKTSEKVSLHDWIFDSPLNQITRHRLLPFSNTLVLTGFNVLEGLHIDDPKAADWRDFVFHARGRDLKGASFDFASLSRVDFTGARLEGASLLRAQLDSASLVQALLQGASLEGAHLQGASLEYAQLQGATLDQAQLQGAKLDGAQLQGARLVQAQLQGASFSAAQLQGAMLDDARLQGARFGSASLDAADLSRAFLWRADGHLQSGKDLELDDADWKPRWFELRGQIPAPQPWDESAYQNLRKTIEAAPAGLARDQALARIGRLDCGYPDKALAACDPAAPPAPPGVTGFQAAASDEDYRKALAATLKSIACAGDEDSIFVLSGVRSRLADTGAEAPALIDFIMSPACPVSFKLTDHDRATLQKIKQDALKETGG